MDKPPEVPVKVDIGAKLNIDVKADIPANAMGRLVDAITDLLSPWSEARGLRGDMIRLHREEVAFEIAQRAARRLEIEQRKPHQIPLKVLVPLLEKGSQEDPKDQSMIDMWANLLASAAIDPTISPRYTSILAELTSREAAFLTQMTRGKTYLEYGASIRGVLSPREAIDSIADETPEQAIERIAEYFQFDRTYLGLSSILTRRADPHDDRRDAVSMHDPHIGDVSLHTLSILESLNLITSEHYSRYPHGKFITALHFNWYHSTMLADSLMDFVMPGHPNYE